MFLVTHIKSKFDIHRCAKNRKILRAHRCMCVCVLSPLLIDRCAHARMIHNFLCEMDYILHAHAHIIDKDKISIHTRVSKCEVVGSVGAVPHGIMMMGLDFRSYVLFYTRYSKICGWAAAVKCA